MRATVKFLAVIVLISLLLAPLAEAHKGKGDHHGKGGKDGSRGKHSKSGSNSNEHGNGHSRDANGHRKGETQTSDSEFTCKFEALNHTYDFSKFAKRSYTVQSSDDAVSFSFCRSLAEFHETPQACPKEAGACRKYEGKYENAGETEVDNQPKWNLFENGVMMSFVHGDSCLRDDGNSSTKSTHVQMTCDHSAKFEVDSVEMNDCETIITARTRRACPEDSLHHGGRHHRNRKPIILIIVLALTSFFACLTGICGVCCLIRRRRQQRARLASEMVEYIQPQVVSAPMGMFNPEMIHAMYPNIEMYPMQNQSVPSVPTMESDEQMARRLQAELNGM